MISSIEPKTSRISGGVYFDLFGEDFFSPGYDFIINDLIYNNQSYGGGTVTDTSSGAEFFIPNTVNASARIKLDKVFGSAYDLQIDFERMIKSFPAIDKARVFEVEAQNRNNLSQVVKFGLEYLDQSGHSAIIEYWESSSLIHRESISINPNKIQSFRFVMAGRYAHGYLEMEDGSSVHVGKTSEIEFPGSNILLGLKAPTNGYSREFNLKITNVKLRPLVSLAGYPAKIISFEDEHIYGQTSPADITIGDVIFSREDGITFILTNEFRYVVGAGVAKLVKSFDTIQAVYGEATDPLRENLFSQSQSLQWDKDYFLSSYDRNDNLYVPSLWDPTTGNVPKTFFQSGIGMGSALEFRKIKKYISQDTESWYAHLKHGTYFINNLPYYLFSDESVVTYLKEEKTEDGRSILKLDYLPKKGIPIVASSLTEDIATKKVIDRFRLTKKGRFTGKVQNGIELDAMTDPSLIDDTQTEFIVRYNSNNRKENWRIETSSSEKMEDGNFLYIIQLPETPLENFPLRFSRRDIFFEEKIIANRYDTSEYNTFKYGEGIQNPGEFAIDYQNSQIQVITDREYLDFGVLSYEFDYPAVIEFNNNYVEDRGSWIENPTYSDLRILDDLGVVSGDLSQTKRLSSFPIIDNSTSLGLDQDNFKLFIYNEYDNSFDLEWIRVKDLMKCGPEDKVYELYPESGFIKFGNNINGKAPQKHLKVLAGYKETLKVQFEPESSNDEWIAKNLDLNLGKSSLNSGFLYLSRKKLIPAILQIEFGNKDVLSYETTDLKASVYTQERDAVPGVEINFEIIQGGGSILDTAMVTDPNGEIRTIFTPSSRIEDMGIKIDLFEPGTVTDIPGAQAVNVYQTEGGIPYKVLNSLEPVEGELDKMYLFKILDDNDPFLPYDNITRKGGRFVALYQDTLEGRELVKPRYLAGNALGFDVQLPQPYNQFDANYEPDLRGFYVVGKKTIAVRAYVDVDDIRIYSDIITLRVEYSDLQTGEWTLPIPPTVYRSSQIDTASYIDLDS